MIVKMKKAALLVQSKDADSAIKELRRLGVLHVEHQQPPSGKDITLLHEDLALASEALGILSQKELYAAGPKQADSQRVSPLETIGQSEKRKGFLTGQADWKICAKHIIDSYKRLEQLQEYSRQLMLGIAEWEPWGDFDPEALHGLAAQNVFLKLYHIPESELKKIPSGLIVRKITSLRGMAYCVAVFREKIGLLYKEVALPKMSLQKMRLRLEEDSWTLQAVRQEIEKSICCRTNFIKVKAVLEKELEFYEALWGMGQDGFLAYLVGYVPVDAVELLLETARREKWGVVVTDPALEDRIPTLLRNPAWIRLINPLMKLLEIIPGYAELDISPLFLIFFSLFFGMIIGDAGYGLMYLLVTYLVHRRFATKVQDKRIFSLLYLLSSCAIVWGLLTGTFFGQAWLAKSGVRALAPVLNDPIFLQGMCFFIGTTHLTLAHLWRFAVQVPAMTALAELGWVGILWAAFLLVKMLLLGLAFPGFGKYLIIGGISLVVLFSSPRKNIFATIGAGLGTIALSLMNSFGDIVSYVRLFAVGLAGVAISDAFNAMAAGAAGSGIIGVIIALFILTAGHLLNFVLSPMSVLVHGVRLNVLEFSGHAGITWSGTPYKPLKE